MALPLAPQRLSNPGEPLALVNHLCVVFWKTSPDLTFSTANHFLPVSGKHIHGIRKDSARPQVGVRIRSLLRMRDDVHNAVNIVLNLKVKTPVSIDTGLPEILPLVVLLGAEGWVVQILLQKFYLFEKRVTDRSWEIDERLTGSFGVVDLHRERFVFLTVTLVFS